MIKFKPRNRGGHQRIAFGIDNSDLYARLRSLLTLWDTERGLDARSRPPLQCVNVGIQALDARGITGRRSIGKQDKQGERSQDR